MRAFTKFSIFSVSLNISEAKKAKPTGFPGWQEGQKKHLTKVKNVKIHALSIKKTPK